MRITTMTRSEFTDKLYSYHLNEKNGLQIPGEGSAENQKPIFKGLEQIAVSFANGLWLRVETDAIANAHLL